MNSMPIRHQHYITRAKEVFGSAVHLQEGPGVRVRAVE